ncbi:hypothetical protein T310_2875 [Rasamsonia emersonii CBS 393.64]|uniref:Asl1-like glycosyl hydrolase catalytic domain-containing protein n=1 Tax=Rasamsonia emersonii (strain ATCC 16479 / CBS 393.64 / IMI 116815) TaxID=1408163 RepID=A0A0F4YY49_RASE3|nr:hypothetical protein T310_2875 [Rasamsonia emersonii CBS 393.64]KKA23149.1 hypothetical protein T310_2875 [Rasamsonia emersonii CBS 393.64]
MVSFTNLVVSGLMAASALAAPHHAHSHLHDKRSSSKRGAAYNDVSLVKLITGSSWAYNWNFAAGGSMPSGVEYVPMLWGTKMFDGWDNAVQQALSSGSKHILGFNEPDMSSQANMSPSEAVQYYKQYITPYADKAELGSPAVTNSGSSGQGLSWLSEFLDGCGGSCGQSFIAIHWYNDASQVEDFKNHVNSAISLAAQHGINKVWITEFGATGDAASQVSFLEQVLPWLDSQEAVERYAYFMVAQGTLLSGDALSQIGEAACNKRVEFFFSVIVYYVYTYYIYLTEE